MKQLVISGFALIASILIAAPAMASNEQLAQSVTYASAATGFGEAGHPMLADALAFDREQPLSAPAAVAFGDAGLAARKTPGPAKDKCSFNATRNLFRLRRTECRMV